MSELLRFRLVRAPDRLTPEPHELIRAGEGDEYRLEQIAALTRDERVVDTDVNAESYAGDLMTVPPALMKLDEALGRAGNRLSPNEIESIVGDVAALVGSATFRNTRARLFNTLGAIVGGGIRSSENPRYPTVMDYATTVQRLLFIIGLLELMADDPSAIGDRGDVEAALRWRTIVLPGGLWRTTSSTMLPEVSHHDVGGSTATGRLPIETLSRKPAFADLYVVRQDWLRYEAGEIAHIENVLLGEHKAREHRRRSESEFTTVTESDLQTLDERDTQTTSRFELSTEATREMELALHVEGSVDVKYPPGAAAIVSAHVGASVDFSQSTSDRTATNTAREAIEKAVKKIETRTREMRTARTLTTVEDVSSHGIDNKDGTGHIVGIYRWVNKVDRAQIYRYPNRFLLEFQLPEPGRWWSWMKQSTRAPEPEAPLWFTTDGRKESAKLSVADVTEASYLTLGARYGVKALPPAPAPILRPGAILELKESNDTSLPIKFLSHDKFVVPDGYRAVTWNAWVMSWHHSGFGNEACSVRVAVGRGPQQMLVVGKWQALEAAVSGTLDDLTGQLPIAIMADAPWGIEVTLNVECHRLDAHLRRWQQSVYDMLVDGYTQQREAYERAVRDRADAASIIGESVNPVRTRLMIATELKKHVVELLVGRAVGVSASVLDVATDEPAISVQGMQVLAPIVSFMEQAFEWENLTYMLYPYFWGGRDRWSQTAPTTGADPELAAFLASGSARVIVPARPGLEQVVHFFLHTGLPWGGLQAPAPDEPGYLSIDKEIRALQVGAEDGVPVGDAWEVRLPTTLVVLQEDGELPTNPKPLVP